MAKEDETKKEKFVGYLMKDALGDLLNWQAPKIFEMVGPCDPSAFSAFEASLAYDIASATAELNELSEHQVIGLVMKRPTDDEDILRWWSSYSEDMLERLQQQEPIWAAGGFGHPEHIADFAYWLRMKRWTLDEATAVSIGFEPASNPFSKMSVIFKHEAIYNFYLRRGALIENNFNWATLAWNGSQEVDTVCRWFSEVDLEVPDMLKSEATSLFGVKFKKARRVDKSKDHTDPRERKAMLRLIIGMAVGGYGFDPKAVRSKVPSEIASDLDLLGISMDLDTLRKYLREGSAMLDIDKE